MGDDRVPRAVKEHEMWLKVWKLVEALDGKIRYCPDQYKELLGNSEALAKLVKPAVLRSQEALNEALLAVKP